MSEGNRKFKVCLWGCLVCKSLKNSVLDKKCPTCGAKREPDRYGFSLLDVYYLCQVNTTRAFPQVTISRLSPPESTITVKLPTIQESLLDAVKEAVTMSATPLVSTQPSSNGLLNDKSGPSQEGQQEQQGNRLDLYHKVMDKAKNLEYDVIMGQFIPAGAANSPSGAAQHKDLKYVQSMKKEKDAMDKIVKDTILSRGDNSPHTKALNANEDTLNEWKAKVPCTLCGYPFPPAQLLGSISNHSILNWMKEHHALTDSKECKKLTLQAYEAAKLCLFCTQFFDENYANTFDVEISANEEFRSRRNEDKKHENKESKEDKVIAKLNEKLSIAELKSKKETIGIRFREAQDEDEVNAEKISKLQSENRSIKFQEAKEKFRRHKANLAKKTRTSRTQSASDSSLPSLAKADSQLSGQKAAKSKGSYTSRSAGNEKKKKPLPESASDSKLTKTRQRRNRNITATNKDSLPSISNNGSIAVSKERQREPVGEEEGDLGSVASLEGSIDSIEHALNVNNSMTSLSPKKKKKKRKKEIVHRMTKKEIARLELLKEIAEKKEKEERRFTSRKRHHDSDWSSVRVGHGGEETDMRVFRDKEKRAAMLIEEYEREVSKHQQSPVKMQRENTIDRPAWDNTDVKKPLKPAAVRTVSQEYSEDEDDDEEADLIEAEDEIKKEAQHVVPFLKPTITLEMLQQHKQHLQAMHFKHLETHIDTKNLEEQSRPPTKEAPLRVSITKDMLENHKKLVLSSTKDKNITVTDKPIRKDAIQPTQAAVNSQNKSSKLKSQNMRPGGKGIPSLHAKPVNQNRNRIPNPSQHLAKKSKVPSSKMNMNKNNRNSSDHEYSDDDFSEKEEEEKEKTAAKKVTVHHDDNIDVDDGFDATSLCSSHEYGSDDDFENDSQVVDDDDVDTPAMMDCEEIDEEESVVVLVPDSVRQHSAQKLSTIVSQDTYDCTDDDNVTIQVLPLQHGTKVNDSQVEEDSYAGFDSFMDSLQQKAAVKNHSPIALLNPPSNPSTAPKRHVKLREPRRKHVHTGPGHGVKQDVNTVVDEVEDITDDILFDDEDDTPYDNDDDLYAAAAIRCSPLTVDNEIEDEVDVQRFASPSHVRKKSVEAVRGIELLRGGSRGASSRGAGRKTGKSNRLEPYENTARPLSRSAVTSSGSVRKGSQSNRLEQYDNVKGKTTDLESSGQFSASGVFSPPASAVRRRKRSEALNKLEIVDPDMMCSSPGGTSARRKSINSRSSVKTQIEVLNKLDVLESDTNGGSDNRKNSFASVSSQPRQKRDSILPSTLEHRDEPRKEKKTNENSATTPSVNCDSKLDQKNSDYTRLPHRNEAMSKISKKMDDTPSMLDLSIMKFNGEVKLKRLDSFDRLSKRIVTKQQESSPSKLVKMMKESRRISLVAGK